MAHAKNEAKRAEFLRIVAANRDESGKPKRGVLTDAAQIVGVAYSTCRDWFVESQLSTPNSTAGAGTRVLEADRIYCDSVDVTDDILVLLNTSKTLKQAWEQAVRMGIYDCGYVQFTRVITRLPREIRGFVRYGSMEAQKQFTTMSYHVLQPTQTYVFDHTELDMWIVGSKGVPVRVQVSFVVDHFSGLILAWALNEGTIDTSYIGALLIESFRVREETTKDGEIIEVGGVPTNLVHDNALAHLSEPINKLCMQLNIIQSPIPYRSSWQQGAAEGKNALLAHLAGLFPGSTGHGKSNSSHPKRYKTAHGGRPSEAEKLLSLKTLEMIMRQFVRDHNLPRLEKWADNAVELTDVPESTMRMYMLSQGRQHTISDGEVRFRNRDYVAPELGQFTDPNRKVNVYYLPNVAEWIEVEQGKLRVRLWDKAALPEHVRLAILARNRNLRNEIARIQDASRRRDAVNAATLNQYSRLPEGQQPHYMEILSGQAPPLSDEQLSALEMSDSDHVDCNGLSSDGTVVDPVAQLFGSALSPTAVINGKESVPRIRSTSTKRSGRGSRRTPKAVNNPNLFAVLNDDEGDDQ